MNITSLLNQIENQEVVLPAIQRDFVWSESKIEKMFDSIMRGYPIGMILLWETYNDIQHRYFLKGHTPGKRYSYHDNSQNRKIRVVLDGQQRLQSLYTSLYGVYDNKYLYFDVLSGREKEDFEEDKFYFRFLSTALANQWNKAAVADSKKPKDEPDKEYEAEFYMKSQDLFMLAPREKEELVEDMSKKLNLSDDDRLRLSTNITMFHHTLYNDQSILTSSVLDENRAYNSPDRKSESDVLEAFVRINTEGTQLSRSDLIFSMLKLSWKESAVTLPSFVDKVNEGNSFGIDTDFVIRSLFAVSDLGTKFEMKLLRKKSNVEKMQKNFNRCCDAISSTLDFVQRECWCSNSKVLGGYFNLIPFVYYLYHTKNHQVPNDQIVNTRKSLFLFGFTRPFSRYADSRLAKFIKDELKPLADQNDETFPYEPAIDWVSWWEDVDEFGEKLIRRNVPLTLHLIQRQTGAKIHYKHNFPETDHIFPKSILRDKNFREEEVNHFANFWILGSNKNKNKSNLHPKDYFKDVPNSELKKALIDRKLFNYGRYRTFLNTRSEKMLDGIQRLVGFSEADFEFLLEEDET